MRWWAVTGLLALAGAFLAELLMGSVELSPKEVWTALLGHGDDPVVLQIVRHIRLPRALTALVAGAALATSGLLMQTLFRNALAGPYVLGISAGASFGVALVVLAAGTGTVRLLAGLGLAGDLALAVAASAGAGLVLLAVLMASRRVDTSTLLILGLLFGYGTGALVTVLLYFARAEEVQAYIAWTFGSFGGVTWDQLAILGPAAGLGLGMAWLVAKPLNGLLLGEATARGLGVAVRPVRIGVICCTALLAGAVTAFCGPVGFLGVAVPHLVRALTGSSDHRYLVPGTALAGALMALAADLVAQLPGSSAALPLNAVTALLGAPVIAWVILRRGIRPA